MGRTRGPYKEEFPVGTSVRILAVDELNAFAKSWRYHHPLTPDQLQFAGATTQITKVGFYHGDDELYELRDVPGIWHEACLSAVAISKV